MSSLPPSAILVGAVRWMEQLRHSSVDEAWKHFMAHPKYTDLTPTQYGSALTWLEERQLVVLATQVHSSPAYTVGSQVHEQYNPAAIAVLEAAIEHSQPFWLQDADLFVREAADLPADVVEIAEDLGVGANGCLAATHAAWGKVDAHVRAQLGSAGESALVEFLGRTLTVPVVHVSAYSDQYGFDVLVQGEKTVLPLEVKTTRRRGRLTVYLSRNEYEVMCRTPSWLLTVVLLDSHHQISGLATVWREWIKRNVPGDQTGSGRWEAVRLEVPAEAVSRGIRELRGWVKPSLRGSSLVDGVFTATSPPAWLAEEGVQRPDDAVLS